MPDSAAPYTAKFVQACLRARLDPAALDVARKIAEQEDFDWEAVIEMGREQVVTPILYSVLRDEAGLPEGARDKLRATYVYTGRRNRALFAELAQVLPALEAASLRPILLKGAPLAASAYGDPALRQLRDLDFFIEAEQLAGVIRALEESAYEAVNTDVRGDAVITYGGAAALRKSDIVETILEFHTTLLEPPIPITWFQRTAIEQSVGPARPLVLGPEANIVYLCFHAWARHAAGGLLWLHDIAEAVRHGQDSLDWEQALDNILQHDLSLPVDEVLGRVAKEWGAPVPAEVLRRLRPPAGPGTSVYTARRPGPLRQFWADLAAQGGWGKRAALTWRMLFPARAYMQRRYHVAYPLLLPLYYPLRWLEGLRRIVSAR